MLNVRKQKSVPEHRIELDVEVVGMQITVKAGVFRYGGTDYELLEDYVYDVLSPTEYLCAYVHLMRESATGVVVIGVEETTDSEDGRFIWEGAPYEHICELYTARVDVGAVDLDAARIDVNHMVEEPPLPAKEG